MLRSTLQSKSIVRWVDVDWKVVRKTAKKRRKQKRGKEEAGKGRTSHSVTIATAASNPILMTPRPS